MHLKKIHGLIISIALVTVLIAGSQSPSSATHIPHNNARQSDNESFSTSFVAQASDEFTLPPLTYAYDALEPYIDSQTMTLHHDKHHAGYVKNLNEAIAPYPDLQGQSVEELLQNLDTLPEDIQTTVRNNGGGHANHTMFWSIMTGDSQGEPTGEIAEAIDTAFGDFQTFQSEFNDAGKKRFGSGWTWLVMNEGGELEVISTANQDSPLLEGKYPIMGNDVWEHAYYLKYQNKRDEYLDAWWNVVDWSQVNDRFQTAKSFT